MIEIGISIGECEQIMKKFKLAATLMMIQAIFMEIATGLGVITLFFLRGSLEGAADYFSFIVPYLNEHLMLMLIMSLIFGIVRLIGAVGLWKNRMWGLALSLINCVVTMVLMIFMLPAGIMDGILSCAALILMLWAYYGDRKIV